MRFVRVGEPGRERPAVVDGAGRFLALPHEMGDIDGAFWHSGGIERAQDHLDAGSLTEVEVTRLGAPIAAPGKILCIGLNYRDHAIETNSPIPTEPVVFMKAPNCVVGPNDTVLIPRGSSKTDWEVELGIVIGAQARYLASAEDAWSSIAGYVMANDVSERAFQIERGGQWDKGKSCETFNPLGPWLTTSDEALDHTDLALRLSVNDEVVQEGNTSQMRFGVAALIHYISQFMVLEPGDLINTGTPPGTGLGMDPPRYLRAGDVMEASIAGLGTQRQTCRAAQADPAALSRPVESAQR
jgi:2-keto-4-pentenoate hydratase/2-oxohepta-3-ene-1,7-dioic acid hydratase in catechol pathway